MNATLLGTLLKKLRKQANMNQEQLADTLGVSISAISKWETGKNLPDIEKITALSKLFSVSVDDLCHPEQTIAKLEGIETFPSNDSTPKSKKTKLRIVLIIACVLVVLFLIILCLMIRKEKQTNARPYASRMIEEELMGSVYEMAIIYSGDLDSLIDPTSDYMELVYQDWCNNTNVPPEITTMKVSFYETEEAATQWAEPDKSIYFFRWIE